MSQRRLELDSAIAERKPLLLVWNGEEYNLPGAIQASAVLDYLPDISEGGGIPQAKLGLFFSDLIGEHTYRMLLERGLLWPDLQEIVAWLLREYGLIPAEGEDAEEGVPSANPPLESQPSSDSGQR